MLSNAILSRRTMHSKKETYTASDLEDEFQSFMDTPLSELQENAVEEYVRILNTTDWIIIAFIRTDGEFGIEVEVSLPTSICGEAIGDIEDQMNLTQDMMTHIWYIKKLLERGFTLSIIKEDCLWVASYLTESKPSLDVFKALVPPSDELRLSECDEI